MCVDHSCFDLLLSLHPTWVLGSLVAYKEPSITPPPSDLLTVEHSQNQTKSRSNKSAQMIWMGYGLIKILIFAFIRHSSRQISGRIKMLNKDLDQRNAAFMKYKKNHLKKSFSKLKYFRSLKVQMRVPCQMTSANLWMDWVLRQLQVLSSSVSAEEKLKR